MASCSCYWCKYDIKSWFVAPCLVLASIHGSHSLAELDSPHVNVSPSLVSMILTPHKLHWTILVYFVTDVSEIGVGSTWPCQKLKEISYFVWFCVAIELHWRRQWICCLNLIETAHFTFSKHLWKNMWHILHQRSVTIKKIVSFINCDFQSRQLIDSHHN